MKNEKLCNFLLTFNRSRNNSLSVYIFSTVSVEMSWFRSVFFQNVWLTCMVSKRCRFSKTLCRFPKKKFMENLILVTVGLQMLIQFYNHWCQITVCDFSFDFQKPKKIFSCIPIVGSPFHLKPLVFLLFLLFLQIYFFLCIMSFSTLTHVWMYLTWARQRTPSLESLPCHSNCSV